MVKNIRKKNIQYVPITEFRHHVEKWLEICQHEDIVITRYGKPIIIVIGYERWEGMEKQLSNLNKKRF